MVDPNQLLLALWGGIFVIWAISGLTSRRTVSSGTGVMSRISLWGVLAAWILLFNRNLHAGALGLRFVPEGQVATHAGVAATILGLAFALWARFAIGRNWGGDITVQEGHTVARTGPYAIVRHPIYAGFMLATLGTAIAFGEVAGLISTALVMICWGYKARLEEAFMIEKFGQEYEQYRRDVKGLIPYVW